MSLFKRYLFFCMIIGLNFTFSNDLLASQDKHFSFTPHHIAFYQMDGSIRWEHTVEQGILTEPRFVSFQALEQAIIYLHKLNQTTSKLIIREVISGEVIRSFDFSTRIGSKILLKFVPVDAKFQGVVDKIYVSLPDGRTYLIDTEKKSPTLWFLSHVPLVDVPGHWLISKPVISRGARQGILMTQAYTDISLNHSIIAQWEHAYDSLGKTMGLQTKKLNWIHHSQGVVSQPLLRQQYLLYWANASNFQRLIVLNNITGSIEEQCSLKNPKSIHVINDELPELSIQLSDVIGRSQVVMFQTNKAVLNDCLLMIDGRSLGRKAWKYSLASS